MRGKVTDFSPAQPSPIKRYLVGYRRMNETSAISVRCRCGAIDHLELAKLLEHVDLEAVRSASGGTSVQEVTCGSGTQKQEGQRLSERATVLSEI